MHGHLSCATYYPAGIPLARYVVKIIAAFCQYKPLAQSYSLLGACCLHSSTDVAIELVSSCLIRHCSGAWKPSTG